MLTNTCKGAMLHILNMQLFSLDKRTGPAMHAVLAFLAKNSMVTCAGASVFV